MREWTKFEKLDLEVCEVRGSSRVFDMFDLASLLDSLLLVVTQHIFSASRPAK
jgi:hypothetical protein